MKLYESHPHVDVYIAIALNFICATSYAKVFKKEKVSKQQISLGIHGPSVTNSVYSEGKKDKVQLKTE